jgi:ATP-binding cassette subfamily G (WHITE) protein 2 (SNQ2)
MCGLEKFADAVVGSLGVEHRKRTTIGVELAAKVGHETQSHVI